MHETGGTIKDKRKNRIDYTIFRLVDIDSVPPPPISQKIIINYYIEK
jgi:hypothetical protein